MTQEEENQIRESLRNHFVFKDITPDVLNLVINELIYCPFKKDTIIYIILFVLEVSRQLKKENLKKNIINGNVLEN